MLPLSLTSPVHLVIALIALGVLITIALVRRPAIPRTTMSLAVIGALLLALAAGGLTWSRRPPRDILVRVDLSPSTRIAGYRERGPLLRRLRQLLGTGDYHLEFFSDGLAVAPADAEHWVDQPAQRTVYPPVDAGVDCVLLFSDCRFPLPSAGPPTYPVIDPLLQDPPDSAVTRLQIDGVTFSAEVRGNDPHRLLTLSQGGAADETLALQSGSQIIRRPMALGVTELSARLAPGDAWPENDALSIFAAPPPQAEQWWVSSHPAPSPAWRSLKPDVLPFNAADYLAPSVIVLENVDADAIDSARQRLVLQYVRDLGGAVLILGGDHAFAAGHYAGTSLETLSPLASSPPGPTTHWMLLADASGSMSASALGTADRSRWSIASEAISQLIPQLPPADLVSIGKFAERASWWSFGKSVRATTTLALPPSDVVPSGPTNLEAALLQIAHDADGSLPTELLVLSDADTTIDHPTELADALRAKRIQLHLLALFDGSGLPTIRSIAGITGGSVLREFNPSKWTQATQQLLRAASPRYLETSAAHAEFVGALAKLPGHDVQPWNRVWLNDSAELLAKNATAPGATSPLAARRSFGTGRVLSVAFDDVNPVELAAMVHLIARAPADPRYHVSWDAVERLRVVIDTSSSSGGYINNAPLTLRLREAGADSQNNFPPLLIPQTGPGHYELTTDSPRVASIATIESEGRVISRAAIAGRYAPEFDAMGNDQAAMQELARRTGGEVIPPNRAGPIDLDGRRQAISLVPWLASFASLLIAAAIAFWRLQ